jgi:hypothetical protein
MNIYVARIESLRMDDDGQVLFTASDDNNNTLFPCSLASSFGGGDGRYSQASVQVGQEVILAAYGDGIYSRYYAISYVPHRNDSTAVNCDGVQSVLNYEFEEGRNNKIDPDVQPSRSTYLRNQDYDGPHIEDIQLEVQDSLVNISAPHGLTLKGIPRVSVQIPADPDTACFRISAGGEASNQVLNAQPHLDRLFDYIGKLQAKIDALEKVVNAMAPGVTTAYTAAIAAATTVGNVPLTDQLTQQTADMTQGVADAAALGPLTPASTIRSDSEQDVNAYVIIP